MRLFRTNFAIREDLPLREKMHDANGSGALQGKLPQGKLNRALGRHYPIQI